MVFGNMDNSGTGVAFTRNPSNGDPKVWGEYLMNAQGEDVVAGIHNATDINQMKNELPRITSYNVCYTKLLRGLEYPLSRGQDIRSPFMITIMTKCESRVRWGQW